MLSQLLTAFLQVLVFALVPFVAYLISGRRQSSSFWTYVGFHRPLARSLWLAAGVAVVMTALNLAVLAAAGLLEVAVSPATVAGSLRFQGLSVSSVILLLLYAGIQTSLSEEILFRGFAAKRLIKWMGFGAGNLVQALLFGALHLLLFIQVGGDQLTWQSMLFLLLSPSLSGWLLGYIKERAGNGSIIPGWLAHGLGNLMAFSYLAFLM